MQNSEMNNVFTTSYRIASEAKNINRLRELFSSAPGCSILKKKKKSIKLWGKNGLLYYSFSDFNPLWAKNDDY